MNKFSFWKHFNWRMLLMRIVVNGLALLFTALLVPTIYFVDRRIVVWLALAVAMGVLNALIKPIIQFLTLRFIFATYGLVVVIINAILLWLLAFIFPGLFEVNSVIWALVGGALFGIFSAVFENLFGLAPPIISEKTPEIRKQIKLEQRNLLEVYLDHKVTEQEATEAQQDQGASSNRSEAAAILAVVGGGSSQSTPVAEEPALPVSEAPKSGTEPLPTAQSEPGPSAISPDAGSAEVIDDVVSEREEA